MYLHVPFAWCAYLCFLFVLVTSVWYLRTRSEGANRIAQASAEIGLLLTALTLLTGSIWGAATWGSWWAWDARVITTVAMGLVYLGYLAARGLEASNRGRTFAAVTGAMGFAIVPVVHFSVLWWRTLHQPPTVLAPSLTPPLDAYMGAALAAAVIACTLLTILALRARSRALEIAGVEAGLELHSQSHADEHAPLVRRPG